MIQLNHLEAKINEHCNYNCVACNSYSNIAEQEVYNLDQYAMDINRVGELFDLVKEFLIVGGEPLLNKDICDYMEITRRYLLDTKIYLYTNGVLLPKMGEDFFQCVLENNVIIHISQYPEKMNETKLHDAKEILEKHSVEHHIVPVATFITSMHFEQNPYDVQHTFDICRQSVDCTNMYNGMIYICPRPFSLRHYDKRFGTSYARMDDGMPLHNSQTDGESILSYLSKPVSTCQYCTPHRNYVKWQQGQAKKNDWQAISENQHIISDIQDFASIVDEAYWKTNTFYFDMTDSTGKINNISMNDIHHLKDKPVYVWVHDFRCIWAFDLLYMGTNHYGIDIKGILTPDSRVESALHYMRKFNFKELPKFCYVLILGSNENNAIGKAALTVRSLVRKGDRDGQINILGS